MQNGRWLRDLAQHIGPASEVYFVQYRKDANDNQSDPQEFQRLARELREMLAVRRHAAFHVSFGSTGSSEEDSEASTKEIEQAPPKSNNQGQKRSGTQSLETKVSKKGLTEGPAVV